MELFRQLRFRVSRTLKTAALILAALFGVSLLSAPAVTNASQTIPYLINFQGRLTDNNGNVMADGSYNIKFRLFTVTTGGSAVWEGDRIYGSSDYRVSVQNGLFDIQLGDTTLGDPALTTSLFNEYTEGQLYLEVELPTPATATCASNGCATWTEGAMTPRQPLASSPYAFNSETLDGIDSSGFVQLGASQTGTIDVSGNITTGGTLQGNTLDAATSGALTIGDTNATSVALAKNTTLANGLTMTLQGNNALTLGSTTGAGGIIFNDGAGSGAVTLTTPTLTGSYSLDLPTAAPTGSGQCLNTSSATQLTFSACNSLTTLQDAYNNSVSPATITTSSASDNIVFQSGTGFNSTAAFSVVPDGTTTPTLVVDTLDNQVGIGTATPDEALTVNGGVNIGNTSNTNAGTIRFTGTGFQGYDGSAWLSLGSAAATNVVANQVTTVYKPTDQTVNNSATLVSDNDLTFTIGANQTWDFHMYLAGNSASTPGFKFSIAAPVGSTCNWAARAESGASVSDLACGSSTTKMVGAGANDLYNLDGWVTTGTTGGSVTLQWAQFTATASNSILRAGSFLQAMEDTGGNLNPFVQGGNGFGATAIFGTTDSNGISVVTNNTEAMHIDATGNVGIGGITSDGSKLDLNGDLELTGVGAPAVAPTGEGRIYFDSSTNQFRVSQNGGSYVDLMGASGANTSLSNLSSVAINSSLLTSTSNTLNIGSAANPFASAYFGTGLNAPQLTSASNTDLSLQSAGSGNLNLSAGSGTLNLAATTVKTTAQSSLTFDLNSAVNSTLYVTNSNAGHVANLDVSGGLNLGSGQEISFGGTQISSANLSDYTSITEQGNTFNGNTELVQTDASGNLPALSGTNLTNLDPTQLVTGSGAVTVQSASSSSLTLTSGTGTVSLGSGTLQRAASALTLDVANAGTSTLNLINSNGANVANLSATGGLTIGSGQVVTVGSTAGTAVTCTSGDVLQNQVVIGGITTGGSCTPSGGVTTLQNAYDNSSSPATITTSSSSKGVVVQSGSGDNSATTFQVIPDGTSTPTLNVDTLNNRVGIGTSSPAYALDVSGDANVSGAYWQGGTSGTSLTCSGTDVIQGAVVAGGIVTAGTCATGGGGGGGGSSQIGASVAQVYDSAGGTNANTSSPAAIPWGAESRVDSGYTHSTLTNPSRVTIVNAGWYQISYNVSTNDGASNAITVECRIRLNGTTYNTPSTTYSQAAGSTNADGTNNSSVMVQASAGDYFEIMCNQAGSAGSAPTIADQSWVQIQNLGGASPFTSTSGIISQTNATDRLVLKVGATTDAGLEIQGIASQTANYLEVRTQPGITDPFFALGADQKLYFGAGGSSALDTDLYRAGAGILATDGQFQVGTLASATGTPVCVNGSNDLASCSSSWGVTDLQGAYDGSSSPQITLSSAGGALTVIDASSPLSGNLFQVQNHAGTTTYLGVTSTGVTTSGSLSATGGVNIGSGQQYQVNGTQISSANLSDYTSITEQGNTFNGNTELVQTDASGNLPALSGTNLTNLDPTQLVTGSGAVTVQSASSSSLTLTSGTGTVSLGSGTLQRAASALTLDVTSGGTSTLNVLNSNGSNVANLSVSGSVGIGAGGAYSVGASSGGSLTCSGGQFLQNEVVSGGITTGGTCAATTATDLQTAYNASSTPAAINLANGKDLDINATNQTTAPNVVVNLECSTCADGTGRFGVQNSGTDVFTVNPSGDVIVHPTAGQDLAVNLSSNSQLAISSTSAPANDQVSIDNSGTSGVSTNDVNGLHVNYKGGTGAIEAAGMRIDYSPGSTSGSTWSGLRIVANSQGAGTGINGYGIKLEGPTVANGGNDTAIEIASGWDIGLDVQSGGIQLGAVSSTPTAPSSNNLILYSKSVAGRMLLHAEGSSGVSYPLQPSFFQNQIVMINDGVPGSCVVAGYNAFGLGIAAAGTTCTAPVSETYGYMKQIATAATAATGDYVYSTNTIFMRGSVSTGANGFFFNARIAMPQPTASYAGSSRIFLGLTDKASTVPTATDNPAGNRVGFSYVNAGGRADTDWQISTKDNTTENLTDTGMVFTGGDEYDVYLYCPHVCTSIYWRIDDLTAGTSQQDISAGITGNLPVNTTALRPYYGLYQTTAVIHDIMLSRIYGESDR